MDKSSARILRPVNAETARADADATLTSTYGQIVSALGILGYPVTSDDNYTDTAARAARAMLELVRPVDETARGIEAHEASGITSAVRGAFRDQAATRQEFLDLVATPRVGLL